jgi:hypothetical protein
LTVFGNQQVVDKYGNPCYDIEADVGVEITFPPGLDTGASSAHMPNAREIARV